VKDKVAWILDDSKMGTCGGISPRIKRSFVERRYPPSSGMDRNEWKIILGELLVMDLIVKEEVVSENHD
jgi:hypothetical protein